MMKNRNFDNATPGSLLFYRHFFSVNAMVGGENKLLLQQERFTVKEETLTFPKHQKSLESEQ